MTYPGQAKQVLIGFESTWGTAVVVADDVGLIVTDVSDPLVREVKESRGISSIEAQKITTGMFDPSFSMEGEFQHGRLFRAIIGTETPVNTSSDYKHTFAVSQNPESLTIESGENLTNDTGLLYTGMIVESAEISTALNEVLKLSVEFKGKGADSISELDTSSTSSLAVFPHAMVNVTLAGISASEVQEASITINKAVERSGGLGSNFFQQGHATKLAFEFSAKLGFTDSQFQALFLDGTTTAGVTVSPASTGDPTGTDFKIQADNGVTLGSGRREFSMTLSSCQYSTFTKTAAIESLTFIDVAGTGLFSELFTVDNIASL